LTTAARVVGNAQRAARRRGGRAADLGALLIGMLLVAGCGQRGPLSLPDSARPIERLDPSAQPPAQPPGPLEGVAQPAPAAAAGSTTPAQSEPPPEEPDASKDKPRRPENER
jgi:predicted small lipoprotein YifL